MSNIFAKKLESKIKEQAAKYYTDGSQELSDAEFDALVDQLREVDPESELLKHPGWGYDPESNTTGSKVSHRYGEVGSLEKCHNWKELGSTLQDEIMLGHVVASLKLDGMSVVLYYENGNLVQAVTRGDGHIGIDITDKVVEIDSRVAQIDGDYFTGGIRCEILMPWSEFEQYQSEHPEVKNPRNATAGIIGRNEVSKDLKRLRIVAYRIIGSNYDFMDYEQILRFIDIFGLEVVPCVRELTCVDEGDLTTSMEALRCAWYADYPADGIVLTPNRIQKDDEVILYPNSKAYKFPSEVVQTEVIDVEWTMSKTHYAVPRVHVKPVQIAGTTVEWCTGYNAQYIQTNRVGPGAIVEITKCGEIIPNIVRVVKIPKKWGLPLTCPVCSEVLSWNGVHLVCNNPDCSNARLQDLSVWLETLAPVEGLKDKLKFKLLSDMLQTEDLSIDAVMEYQTKFQHDPEATGQKKLIMDMLYSLYFGTFVNLSTALKALNIPRFGDVTCEKAANYYKHIEWLYQYAKWTDPSEWATIPYDEVLHDGIGDANYRALTSTDGLRKLRNLRWIEHCICWKPVPSATVEFQLIAITGKLSVPRTEFEALCRLHGFRTADVSKNTVCLVTDDPNSSSSKNKKADQLGVPKMTESEFRNKYLI